MAKTLTISSTRGAPGMATLSLKNVGEDVLMESVGAAPSPFGGGGGGTVSIAPRGSTPVKITFAGTSAATVSITVTVEPPSTPASATVTLKGIVKK